MNTDPSAARPIILVLFVGLMALPLLVALFSGEPFLESIDWLWVSITAVITAVTFPLLWFGLKPPAYKSKEFAGAELGIGTLVQAVPTGTEINDQPKMSLTFDVEKSDCSIFRAECKEIIDLGTLAQLVPGSILPIYYLPDNRIAVAFDANQEQLQEVVYAVQLKKGKITPQQLHVAKTGRDAQAVILEMKPTGVIIDGEAEITLRLSVTRPDGTTFETERTMPVPNVALPQLQPGQVLGVRYLPHDESYVSITMRVR